MKIDSFRIMPTDDGAFVVECCGDDFGTSKRYTAETLADIPAKIQEAMDAIPDKKKEKKNAAQEMKNYLGGDEDSDEKSDNE